MNFSYYYYYYLVWDAISKANYDVNQINRLKVSSGLKNFKKIYQINQVIRNRIDIKNIPTIYVITPTYSRPTQQAELTRLKNTLRNVPKVIWVVVEDSKIKSDNLRNFLHNSGLTYIHLNVKSKVIVLNRTQLEGKPGHRLRLHRGSDQRNKAIDYLKNNSRNDKDLLYFADDDNSYSISLFQEVLV